MIQLGSSRSTNDIDYLMLLPDNPATFIHEPAGDIINAAGHKFFGKIYELEQGNDIASPQSMLELKAFALVQHCLHRNWQKADDCEYDIKFLCRTFKLRSAPICRKYVTSGQYSEIQKIINTIQNEK